MYKNILLASHGTVGAKAAENTALKMCSPTTHLTHLFIVPDFWKHMLGDDWLNNSNTRIQFEDYLESQLTKDVEENIIRVENKFRSKGVDYLAKVVFGTPEKCLLETCCDKNFNCVVIGSPRPKDMPGITSKMFSKVLAKKLNTPLVTVPHPNA